MQPYLYADAMRNTIYQSWLASSRLDGKTLCEIGFGSGVLSLMALNNSPKHIVAYEDNGEHYELAQWCLKKSGLDKKITLRNEFVKPSDLDNDIDLIFHELISGHDIWEEGVFEFIKLPKPIIPSVYINEFYVVPLDYGLLNSKKRLLLPIQNLGLSNHLRDHMHETVKFVTSEHMMYIPKLPNRDCYEQKENYVRLFNEKAKESTSVHIVDQIKQDVFIQHMQNSHMVGRITFDSVQNLVEIHDGTNSVIRRLDEINLEDIQLMVPQSLLHNDYMLIAVARLSHNNNAIKCEKYISWGNVGVWNFISSRHNHPRDLYIGYLNKSTYHGHIFPTLSVKE